MFDCTIPNDQEIMLWMTLVGSLLIVLAVGYRIGTSLAIMHFAKLEEDAIKKAEAEDAANV